MLLEHEVNVYTELVTIDVAPPLMLHGNADVRPPPFPSALRDEEQSCYANGAKLSLPWRESSVSLDQNEEAS